MEKKIQLVLASGSPRRKELMQWIYAPFEILIPNIEENSSETEPGKIVMDLALQKAAAGFELSQDKWSNPLVVGSDTIVFFNGEVLGKPKDRNEAKEILSKLSGQKHYVYTGVSFKNSEKSHSFFDKTLVEFETIEDILLEKYLDTGESMDKAGAYGIQGASLGFIKRIEGSYSNVVGFPLNLILDQLESFIGSAEWRKLV